MNSRTNPGKLLELLFDYINNKNVLKFFCDFNIEESNNEYDKILNKLRETLMKTELTPEKRAVLRDMKPETL